ncbi:hypothetical protein WJ972_04150 [Achromobacter insuavis]
MAEGQAQPFVAGRIQVELARQAFQGDVHDRFLSLRAAPGRAGSALSMAAAPDRQGIFPPWPLRREVQLIAGLMQKNHESAGLPGAAASAVCWALSSTGRARRGPPARMSKRTNTVAATIEGRIDQFRRRCRGCAARCSRVNGVPVNGAFEDPADIRTLRDWRCRPRPCASA